ncbi:MAG: adenylate/guanylate cyclase domain-containing protein [Candidatus Gracilibacteria bacterium]|nr:adenylate/guanylate cyclase domain-containing protein [Candidatus Gracilibacteria bacterium]MDD3120279.1 adenylate/guanylate cyclase domain-containing protein [Candidatus Gracilibacteria bacterium]MDD4530174.1 adenylate/guanylate cyclase domain-containing protein [Candidatus Gracilibacteria bacterium]
MKTSKLIINKFLISSIITFFVIGLISVLATSIFSGYLEKINLNFSNLLYSNNIGPKQPGEIFPISNMPPLKFGNDIIVLEIDDKTLQNKDSGGLGRWQEFKRSYYAEVIKKLKKDGANIIGLDFIFSEKSADSEDDLIFQKAIEKSENVILGFSEKDPNSYPLEEFSSNAKGVGFFNVLNSEVGTEVYGINPFVIDKNNNKNEAFSIVISKKYLENIYGAQEESKDLGDKNDYNFFKDFKILLSGKQGQGFLINYISDSTNYFNKLSFVDVYNDNYDKNLIKNKIVLIGTTSFSLHDKVLTPNGIQSGVYVHANAINTILKGNFIKYFNGIREGLLMCFLFYILILAGIYFRNRFTIITYICFSVGYFLFYKFSFIFFSTIFYYPIYFYVGVILSFTGVNIYKYTYENKGKRLLKSTLSQYLSEELVMKILNNYEEVKLTGEKKNITAFFTDIAGFTGIAEELEPEKLVEFLRHYLKEMSNIIVKNKGFINKYEGDAIMALWGTFNQNRDEQILLACKTAVEQQEKLKELNPYYKETFGFELKVRIGINYGDAIVGNIGSEGKKIEYTALGNNINMASRLEGINKEYNTLICVSESVRKNTPDNFIFRKLDNVKLKGKQEATIIYELLGEYENIPQEKFKIISDFEKGLDFYIIGDFVNAYKIFEGLAASGDSPSKTFEERCKTFLKYGTPTNWNGIWEAKSK